jgi:hypothetical protein
MTEISLQYISYKIRHKKVQHSFLKKKLNLESQVEEKKWAKHPRSFLGFTPFHWTPSKLFPVSKKVLQKQ